MSKNRVRVRVVYPKSHKTATVQSRGNIIVEDVTPRNIYRQLGGGEEYRSALQEKSQRITSNLMKKMQVCE